MVSNNQISIEVIKNFKRYLKISLSRVIYPEKETEVILKISTNVGTIHSPDEETCSLADT